MYLIKTTLLLLSATILIVAACSESGYLTAPNDMVPRQITVNDKVYDKAIAPSPEPENVPLPIIALTGTLRIIGETGGCIYLEPEQGEFPHELDFSYCVPSPGPIKSDIEVKVQGRFSPNYHSDCVGGAVLLVFEITFLEHEKGSTSSAADHSSQSNVIRVAERPDDSDMAGCCLTYSGTYRSEEEGCGFLELSKADAVKAEYEILELTFQEMENPGIPEGSTLEVTGNYRLLDKSPCGLGPLFNVIVFDIIDEGEFTDEHRSEVRID